MGIEQMKLKHNNIFLIQMVILKIIKETYLKIKYSL